MKVSGGIVINRTTKIQNNKTTNLCRDIKTVFNYTDGDLENATTTIETTQMLTTRTPSTCPDGYKMFQRKTVQVCLGVEYDVKTFNKPRAMEMCSNIGGFISGPDSLEERDYLRDTVMEMRKSSITAFRGVGIWVDGDKKKECVGLSAECKTLSSFVFLDETMQSLGGYHFYKGQPDGILGLQNCLQLMVIKNGQNGFLDDQGCASPYGYGVVSSAIACAKIIS
ncbi:unnamed protein product [Caenorhabditis nigoni]